MCTNNNNTIIKSPNDKASYYTNTLPNGIKYLIITDPDADTSACSLDISIGSIHDPPHIPGLAHFLEHTILLGTEKYPSNAFNEFLSKNSGNSNAYTTMNSTNYHFEIGNDAIEKALDMFSTFFICPLFNEDLIERELSAVNSEFKLMERNDKERLSSIITFDGYNESPYRKFTFGNMSTLKINNIRNEVINFYKTHYTPSLMCLCVLSPLDKTTMQTLIENTFGKIIQYPQYKYISYDNCLPLYNNLNMSCFYKTNPVSNMNNLYFLWVLNENGYALYKSQPYDYITSLLNHEGKNSLCELLKSKALIRNLLAEYSFHKYNYIDVIITISLTELGIEQYNEVINIVLFYIEKLKRIDISERFYNEIQQCGMVGFTYYEKDNALSQCIDMVENMQEYPISDIIRVNYVYNEYNPQIIKDKINLLNENNMNIYLVSKKNELSGSSSSGSGTTVYTTPYFNVQYTKDKVSNYISINKTTLNVNISDEMNALGYPNANEFIPHVFDLCNYELNGIKVNTYKYPKKIIDNINHIIWYKPDTQFLIPKCYLSGISYISNLNMNVSLFIIYTQIYALLLDYELTQIEYMGELFQNSFELQITTNSIIVNVSGFSDIIYRYVSTIISIIKDINQRIPYYVNKYKQRLINGIENLIRKNTNINYKGTDIQSYAKLKQLLAIPYVDNQHKDKILKDILNCFKSNNECFINEMFVPFINGVFSRLKFEWLVQGNILPKHACDIVTHIESGLKATTTTTNVKLSINEIRKFRIVKLPHSVIYKHYFTSKDELNEDSCLLTYIQIANTNKTNNIKLKALTLLIEQIFSEDFFDELRTQQQLGYQVSIETMNKFSVLGLAMFIQSEKYHPDYIYDRINTFFVDFDLSVSDNFTDEDFESYKSSVINELKERDLTLNEEFERNFEQIILREYQFNRKELLIQCLENEITKEDVIMFFKEYIYDRVRRIDIGIVGIKCKNEPQQQQQQAMDIDDDNDNDNDDNDVQVLPSVDVTKNPNVCVKHIESIEQFHNTISHYDTLFY